jgi:23S rRNA pseudouridine1911/1915/1917 synthase
VRYASLTAPYINVQLHTNMVLNQGWIYREQVPPSAAGQTILSYYTKRYPHSSPAEWQQRITTGQVLVADQPTSTDTILKSGQPLSYHRPPWEEPDVPLNYEILHQEPDFLVITKPAGMPVLPGGGFLQNTLLWQLQQQYPEQTPVPIHRLGRGTSGLMLLARSPLARSSLTQQLRDRQIRKIYRALVEGIVVKDQFTIQQPIGKIDHPTLGYLYAATPNGSFAHSDCLVLERRAALDQTRLEVTILTGRPHQIRIHVAAVGHPLVGDPLYGLGGVPKRSAAFSVPGDCGYCLHAYHLEFLHPQTQEKLSFTAAEGKN